jgi:hypothetical protein
MFRLLPAARMELSIADCETDVASDGYTETEEKAAELLPMASNTVTEQLMR